jgi:hypothetical protein
MSLQPIQWHSSELECHVVIMCMPSTDLAGGEKSTSTSSASSSLCILLAASRQVDAASYLLHAENEHRMCHISICCILSNMDRDIGSSRL